MARLYGTGCIVGDKKAACITLRREASHRERAIFNSDNKPVLVAVLRLFHDDIRVCLLGKPLFTRDRSPKICLVFVLFVVHPTRPSCISGQKSIKLETGTTATTRLARFHSKVIWKRVISPRTLICFLGVQ